MSSFSNFSLIGTERAYDALNLILEDGFLRNIYYELCYIRYSLCELYIVEP